MPPKDKAKDLFLATTPMTAMDKSSSQARLITDEQNARRAELTASLRAQRLARDATEAGAGDLTSLKGKPKKR